MSSFQDDKSTDTKNKIGHFDSDKWSGPKKVLSTIVVRPQWRFLVSVVMYIITELTKTMIYFSWDLPGNTRQPVMWIDIYIALKNLDSI